MGKLDGRVVIITGGARGQGAAECRLFRGEGANVVITDILTDEGEALAAETGATFIRHDVTDEAGWGQVARQTVERYGPITGLVNNAAISRREGLLETNPALYRQVIDINQVSVYLGMYIVAPIMSGAGGGSIVNVSSVAGFIGQPTNFAYSAAKWAIRGMTRCAALELASAGIRVNSVHPGPIDTPMIPSIERPAGTPAPSNVPLGRRGTAEEVAKLVFFLISDESAYCTGAEFVIDGGMIAG